jgi:hypothetical protein
MGGPGDGPRWLFRATRTAGRRAVITSSGRRWLHSGPRTTARQTVGRPVFLYIAVYAENSLFCRVECALREHAGNVTSACMAP